MTFLRHQYDSGVSAYQDEREGLGARRRVIPAPLELWGGVEASIVRLGNEYRDQCAETGHAARCDDLDLVAGLGIRTLRYPFLWETCAPQRIDQFEWEWCDSRAERMQKLGIAPIAGLLHHGSGPRYTQLSDPNFPALFERYAHAAAMRYPWIAKWTPINEPLTTARFSGLYGVWYPHARSESLFWKMLLNQIEATALAMKAIRKIRSDAQLVQTEDLGTVVSTPECAAEAQFQNDRRWLTWDLLCGRVDGAHPLWDRIARFGHRDRLLKMVDNPCAPDVIGINHYLTSNRFLDGRHARAGASYDDVEAVRSHTSCATHGHLLELAWQRYGLPVAITEVHNGCTRDEQLRWTIAAWTAAVSLRDQGIPVKAVNLWALFGCQDWASLLTKRQAIYEPGAFDIRGPQPRPTALARLGRSLASQTSLPPQLEAIARAPGWWERPIRFTRPPAGPPAAPCGEAKGKPILVIGQGRLGTAIRFAAGLRGLPFRTVTRQFLDITRHDEVESVIADADPWAVINTTAYNGIERSERNPELCFAVNTHGAVAVAQACARLDIACVTCSSDLVFDGQSDMPYRESDQPSPINIYGRSKAEAENGIMAKGGKQLIVRSGGYFGAGPGNFAARVVQRLVAGDLVEVAEDRIFTPSYLPDVADAILDLLIDDEIGLWHLSHGHAASWYSLIKNLVHGINAGSDKILSGRTASPRRPLHTALGSEKTVSLPSLDSAVTRFAAEFHALGSRSLENACRL